MGLEEFAGAVHHLRLYPDAELQSPAFSSLHQSRYAFWQFLGVGYPVAQGFVVVGTAVLTAKPAVVHHEEFAAQLLDAVHHLFAHLLVDVHIDALPRVQQDFSQRLAVVQLTVVPPAVEGPAHAALALFAISECQHGRRKLLARLQGIGRMQVVNACQQRVAVFSARLDAQLVVARPAEGGTDDASAVLLRPAVQRYHHLGTVVHCRTHTVVVDNHLDAGRQRLLGHAGLLAPGTVEVGEPRSPTPCAVALAQPLLTKGHHAAGILFQPYGFLLAIADNGPGLNDVAAVVGLVIEVNVEVVLLILQGDDGEVALLAAARDSQFG